VVTVMAVGLSFVPPPGVASVWLFELKLAGGFVGLVVGARICFHRHREKRP